MKDEIATKKKQTGIRGFFKRKWKKTKQTLKRCFKNKVEPMQPNTSTSNEALFEPTEGKVESYYKFGKLLGEGGFGLVCTGIRISDGQEVAIKIMSRRLNRQTIVIPGHSKPLPVEVALLIKMNEPPISPYAIKMLEWFIDSNEIIIIMEYPQPCVSLNHIIKCNRTLSEETARVIMRQTVQAVINCYDHEVFHSDIHPGNFLVNTKTLDTKLIDFGCGQLYTYGAYKSHKYIGVKDFFPPEVRRNSKFHAIPANVWCLGMVLYEMVNGYKSYVKSKEVQFANPNLSEECRSLIRQCLARDPAKRPSLQQILQHRWFNPE
ncbi:serine/threonine-protein kinase pim-2-like [Paramisgurnus dabryanus]|uniref:serine/threonine-protein kinase pim-2-like n=1 Tax=Paramisgurnus dabryanus TaxID=90735 RepID=UPI003CCF2FDC